MPRCRSISTSSRATPRSPRCVCSPRRCCRASPMARAKPALPEAAEDALAALYTAPGHLIRRCQQIAVAIFMEETRHFALTPVQYAALVVVRAQPGIDQTRLVALIALDRS